MLRLIVGYEGELALFGPSFDAHFPLQGLGAVGVGFRIQKSDGRTGTCIGGAALLIVTSYAGIQIVSDAGIKCVISTFKNV